MFVNAKRVTDSFGNGTQTQAFVDTWFMPKVGGIVIYWPEEPDFVFKAEADFDYRDTEWVKPSHPTINPDRKSYWTKLSFDPVPEVWMLSAVAPLYWADEWYGSVGHDLPLKNLIENTELISQQEGGRFLLITSESRVVASDIYEKRIKQTHGELFLHELNDKIWSKVANLARGDNIAKHQNLRYTFHNQVYFVSHIKGQDWLFINAIPLSPIHQKIDSSFNNLRNIAIGSLFLELLIATSILAWSQKRYSRHLKSYHDVQKQLELREKRYRSLVANVQGIVYRCNNDANWTMKFMSNTTEEITGYTIDELISNTLCSYASIIHPDDREYVTSKVQNSIKLKQGFSFEYRIIRKDKKIRWMLEKGIGIYENNNLVFLEGVILDITERHKIQVELEDMVTERTQELSITNEELRKTMNQLVQSEKLAAMGSLVSGIAHRLNTPLGNLMTLTTYLKGELNALKTESSEKKDPDNYIDSSSDALNSIENNCNIAVNLVKGFKELSVDHSNISAKEINLKELVDSLILSKNQLDQRSFTAQNNIPGDLFLTIYPSSIEKVISHLINNSIIHGFEGKTKGHIFIDAKLHSNKLILTYKDDGKGIPEHLVKHLYDPFSTSRMSQGGGGLGMYLVYNLVTKVLMGDINLIHTDKLGTEYLIELPIQKNTA